MSEMLGVRRSSVSEIAGKLQAANLISYSRGKITITDREALERHACECYKSIRDSAEGALKR
jgi:Mn-dependent DtxR family transcriptional regulator